MQENPILCPATAAIWGGVVQGSGTALYEQIPYDDAGQPLAGIVADYLLLGAAEMLAIEIGHLHTPTPHTEYGRACAKAAPLPRRRDSLCRARRAFGDWR